mgnify:CR=1 FL=1
MYNLDLNHLYYAAELSFGLLLPILLVTHFGVMSRIKKSLVVQR